MIDMDAILDKSRPVLERVNMWLDHPDNSFDIALDFILELSEALESKEDPAHE